MLCTRFIHMITTPTTPTLSQSQSTRLTAYGAIDSSTAPTMAENENESGHVEEPKKFTPKNPPKLDPPKDDPISVEELAKCDGKTTL